MIILDTRAWIWWATESSKLSPQAAAAIVESSIIDIPSISF